MVSSGPSRPGGGGAVSGMAAAKWGCMFMRLKKGVVGVWPRRLRCSRLRWSNSPLRAGDRLQPGPLMKLASVSSTKPMANTPNTSDPCSRASLTCAPNCKAKR
jgi:hypothetical protein